MTPDSDDPLEEMHHRVSEAESRGDLVEALHILRSYRDDRWPSRASEPDPSISGVEGSFPLPSSLLEVRAHAAVLSLMLGQWRDSPRHDPDSDSPHSVLTMYESLNPVVPEQANGLRYWMGKLRVLAAHDHDSFFKMAAWAHDLYQLCESDLPSGAYEALVNMAVAMSRLGFKGTARNLYLRALGDDQMANAHRAALAILYGDFLWSLDDRQAAECWYTTAIDGLRSLPHHNVNDLHNLVRGYARRADCHLKRSRNEDAISDIDAAFQSVDSSRGLGAYQSARSVDARIVEDIKNLLYYLTIAEADNSHARVVATVLSRLGNTSSASRIRCNSLRAGAHTEIYTSTTSSTLTAQVKSAGYWNQFTEADADAVLSSPTPLVMIAASATLQRGQVAGVTLLAGANETPVVKTWRMTAGDASGTFELFNALLTPPPGVRAAPDNVWAKPWDREPFHRLAATLLPLNELEARLNTHEQPSLRIVPAGSLWRFPFGALTIGARPLALIAPYVVAPGLAPNLARPLDQRWYGHFDLTLPNAVGELRETLAAVRRSDTPFTLFNDVEELAAVDGENAVSHLLFSGHGQIHQHGDQRLLLAGGRPYTASDLAGLALGATVLLNACWSGIVSDKFGSDPAQQALELLAGGAHSVLGTLGPISDRAAGLFLRECLPELAAGQSMANAVRTATTALLEADNDVSLATWASYATIGRHTDFATESEAASDR